MRYSREVASSCADEDDDEVDDDDDDDDVNDVEREGNLACFISPLSRFEVPSLNHSVILLIIEQNTHPDTHAHG